jgi:hypothetical protein
MLRAALSSIARSILERSPSNAFRVNIMDELVTEF